MDAEWFLESGEDLNAMAPVLHLNLTDTKLCLDAPSTSPLLDRIHSISLPREELGDGEVAVIAASVHLGRLRRLDLGLDHVGPAGLEVGGRRPRPGRARAGGAGRGRHRRPVRRRGGRGVLDRAVRRAGRLLPEGAHGSVRQRADALAAGYDRGIEACS